VLDALREGLAARRRAAVLTELSSGVEATDEADGEAGAQWLWREGDWSPALPGDSELARSLEERLREALRDDRSGAFEAGGRRFFLQIHAPAPRLIVVGAVHLAQPLVTMASLAGYSVVLVDPREAWATAERFPGVEIDRRWPAAALEAHAPDARTAVVTLSHDPKLDDPALEIALASPAFYIGSLGSRRTHARRLDRLREAGFSEEAIGRIHGPVGLDIGAVSPAEIAVSILAEVTRALRQNPAQ